MRNLRILSWFFVVLLAICGCGGGSGSGAPGNNNSPATVSLGAPSPDPINAGATSASLITMGGTPAPQVACRKDNPNDPGVMSTTSAAVSYTAPSSVSSALAISITCTATNGVGQPASATATFHVNAPIVVPTLTITAPPANSTIGGSVSVTASVINPPSGAQVQFQLDNANLGAAVAVTSGTASMSWDTTTTSNAPHTLGAILVGTAVKSGSVTVTVSNASIPVLSFTANVNWFFKDPPAIGVRIGATNIITISPTTSFFSSLDKFPPDPNPQVPRNMGPWSKPDATHVDLNLNFTDTFFNPGFVEIWAVNPGPNGGESNRLRFGLEPSRFHSLLCSPSECFWLNIPTGQVFVFDRTTGSLLRQFASGSVTRAFARDDKTGDLVFGYLQNTIVGISTTSGQPTGHDTDTGGVVSDVAANSGQICASQSSDNQVASFDINQAPPHAVLHTPVGTTPWNLGATKQGSQVVCLGFNLGDLAFWAVKLPQAQLLWNPVTLVGFTKPSDINPLAFQGGWHLAAFDSGNQAAVLDEVKNQVAFVDLVSGKETLPRIDLNGLTGGHAVAIAPNNSDGSLWVLLWDTPAGVTRFARLVPATGASVVVPGLTVGYGATDFIVSSNGTVTTLNVAGRDTKTLAPRFSILTQNN